MVNATQQTKHRTGRRTRIWIGSALAVSAMMLAGCAATPSVPDPEPTGSITTGLDPQPLAETAKITINTAVRIESFSALFMAQEMGEFEKENIEVEFTQISSADALPGLGQDQLQMMGSAPNGALFNAISQGVDVKMAIPCFASNTDRWWVRNEVFEKGPGALEGSIVGSATGPAGSSTLGLLAYLQDAGLTISDVTVQQYPAADVPTALIQGAVDAAYVPEPGARAVEAAGIATPVDTMPHGSSQCVYVFGPQLLTERPEVGAAVARALARTVRDYLTGDYKADAEIVQHLANALERTPDEITATPSVVFDTFLEFEDDLFVQMQELWLDLGGILSYDESIDPSELIDHRFVDALRD